MTWWFVLLVVGGLAAMAWSFLAVQRLENSVSDLERRLGEKESNLTEKKKQETHHA